MLINMMTLIDPFELYLVFFNSNLLFCFVSLSNIASSVTDHP